MRDLFIDTCRILAVPGLLLLLSGIATADDVSNPVGGGWRQTTGIYFNPISEELDAYMDNFRLLDQRGHAHTMIQYADHELVVLIGYRPDCAHNSTLLESIRELQRRFDPRGIQFLLLNPSLGGRREPIDEALRRLDLDVPVLMDETQMVAASLGIGGGGAVLAFETENWKEVLRRPAGHDEGWLEGTSTALEHALDDAEGRGRPEGEWSSRLGDAWDRTRDRISRWLPSGKGTASCDFVFHDPGPLTYTEDVASILLDRCVTCHRKSAVFDLFNSYEQVKGWSQMIRQSIRLQRMPPGGLDPYYGNIRHAHSQEEMRTILHWIAQGMPRGPGPDPIANTKSRAVMGAERRSAQYEVPDLVYEMEEPHVLPAIGLIEYRYAQLGEQTQEDLYLEALRLDINLSVVHHCNILLLDRPLDQEEMVPQPDGMLKVSKSQPGTWNKTVQAGAGMSGIGDGWVKGDPEIPAILASKERASRLLYERILLTASRARGLFWAPPGLAYFIPKGHYIVLEFHYNASGRVEENRARLELYRYQQATLPRRLKRLGIYQGGFRIPPHARNFVVESRARISDDITVLALGPHMHYRGASARYIAEYPDGNRKILLSIPFFQFKFQRKWQMHPPTFLPAGTTLVTEMIYDNSEYNLANPDPDAWVMNGSQSVTDEMHLPRVHYVDGHFEAPQPLGEGAVNRKPRAPRADPGLDRWSRWPATR